MGSHLRHSHSSGDSPLLRAIHLAGFCAAFISMLVAGLYLVEFARAALLAGGLFMASLASFAGVLLRRRTPLQALLLTILGGLTLLALGFHRFYGEIWAIDRLYGALSMAAGQGLLLSAAVRSPLAQLPARFLVILAAAVVLLISFVAPFSALPNPLGLYYLVAGGYRYDPRTPLYNVFVASLDGDPIPLVTARLDALIGATGLDPLDPHHALTGYDVRGITSGASTSGPVVDVDLYYAGGVTRQVSIPVIDRRSWQQTGIDRLTTDHRPLPGLQLPDKSTPFQLGEPERVMLHDRSVTLMTRWFLPVRSTQFEIAPDGNGLLTLAEPYPAAISGTNGPALWFIKFDGSAPRFIADNVAATAWSGSGRYALGLTRASGWMFNLTGYDIATDSAFPLGYTDSPTLSVVGDRVYTMYDGGLWRADLSSQTYAMVRNVPGFHSRSEVGSFAVAPNEELVAYLCETDLCLAGLQTSFYQRISLNIEYSIAPVTSDIVPQAKPTAMPQGQERPALGVLSLAWSPNGEQLALVTATTDLRGRPELRVIRRDGALLTSIPLGPNGSVDTPQWMPDGTSIFLTVYPSGGRRMIIADVSRGEVYDLSQPHWDAVARLSPDGRYLIVSNGNGGLWRVPVQ